MKSRLPLLLLFLLTLLAAPTNPFAFGPASAHTVDLTSGLVGHWTFDNCDATDSSGNGNDGELRGTPQCVNGVRGKALLFDGVGDYVLINDSPSLRPITQLSFGGWVKMIALNGKSDNNIILNKEIDGIPSGYELGIQDTSFGQSMIPRGNFSFYINGVNTPDHQSGWTDGGSIVQPGLWIHLFVVYDGKTVNTYHNGILSKSYSASGSINASLGKLRIATRSVIPNALDNLAFFHGTIDDVRIYNRALSDAEVRELYSSSANSPVVDHFDIKAGDGSPLVSQQVNTPFDITITARNAFGNIVTGFNGVVRLASTGCKTNPTSVQLTNGKSSSPFMLEVLCAANDQSLTASWGGVFSESTTFNVTNGSGVANAAAVYGKVTDSNGNPLSGAYVMLKDKNAAVVDQLTTGPNGWYKFLNVSPARYRVQAKNSSGTLGREYPFMLTNNKLLVKNITIGSDCNPNGITPVIFLPGILGSSKGGGGAYPILSEEPPSWDYQDWDTKSWGLHDPASKAGWRDLYNYFHRNNQAYELGCTVFPAPYDWRMEIDEASQKYLEKVINYAKVRSGVGRVDIVAHSMGGLLARSYLQSNRYAQAHDINALIMAGTPNNGSANAYYLWQGGDAVILDAILGSYVLMFYSNSILENYHGTKEELSQDDIRQFLRGEDGSSGVKSVGQLEPTYSFLRDAGATQNRPIQAEPNTWLANLNSTFSPYTLLPGGLKLFAGKDTDTIDYIHVGSPDGRYFDGAPSDGKNPPTTKAGDGTVLLSRVGFGGMVPTEVSSSHASLIKNLTGPIYSYLAGSKSMAKSVAVQTLDLTAAETVTAALEIMAQGSITPYLIDPLGRRSGISPDTGTSFDEIPDTHIAIDNSQGTITLDNPVDGTYTLTMSAAQPGDGRLFISYEDETRQAQNKYDVVYHDVPLTFTFSINSASTERLSVNRSPQPPKNLMVAPLGSSSPTTRLFWQSSGETGVTGYTVYSRFLDEPYFVKLGTTTGATGYDTGQPWAVDSTVKPRLYTVTALKADGSESFFSNIVKNDKVATPRLSVIPLGAGGGRITSDPAGIDCGYTPQSGICAFDFPLNTTVTLSAVPNKDSLLTWSGTCSGTTCVPVMSEPREVTATFTFVKPAKVGTTLYDTLTSAYGDSTAGTILAREYIFAGDLNLGTDKAVTIKGGYDAAYTTRSGFTTIYGKLTIGKGSLVADRVVIR